MWAIDHKPGRLVDFLDRFPGFHAQNFQKSSAHAFIIHGQEIANLFGLSRYLCSALLCEEQGETACGMCDGCLALKRGNPLRFYPVFPQGQVLSIDAVRGIQDACRHRLEDGQKQLIALFFPSLMQTEAANALLKTLEEPGENRIFLLVNPLTKFLLPTISSRLSHYHMPTCQSLYDGELDSLTEDYLMARLSDFPIFGDWKKAGSFLQKPMSLADLYHWFLEEVKSSESSFDETLNLQLFSAHFTAARRLAVLHFLDHLANQEFRFLDRELSRMKSSFKDLQDCFQASASQMKAQNREDLGKNYEHWLLKDMKSEVVQRFYRGFLYREIEAIFVDFIRCFENLFLSQESYALLPQEKLLGSQFSSFQNPRNLYELGQKLAEANRMLYNNVPWEALLEEIGVFLLQSQRGD